MPPRRVARAPINAKAPEKLGRTSSSLSACAADCSCWTRQRNFLRPPPRFVFLILRQPDPGAKHAAVVFYSTRRLVTNARAAHITDFGAMTDAKRDCPDDRFCVIADSERTRPHGSPNTPHCIATSKIRLQNEKE